ncbi:MAG: NapC/NirT family cytochrome c [Rhodospirillales bacterium]|nr:NapC/NirT family cytochrome c [Rhodospirillales bacterium]MCW8953196.1 NapC/NirT family cytochrome c [Rhodospirillales bacterium]MCW9002523.1 NapC/NirT family cytochrome c [Rhodospirillales bacterium]
MRLAIGWKLLAASFAIIVIVAIATWQGVESYTASSSFCGGNCHTMSEQYVAWKSSKHHASNSANGKQAECIQCHFEPGGKKTLKAKFIGLRHLAAYLADPKAPLPVRAQIPDKACLSCHDKAELSGKEIKFTEKVRFKHGPHFEKPIEGQTVFCDTCHVKNSQAKHFEVPKETCFACHFGQSSNPKSAAPAGGGKIETASLKHASVFPSLNQGRGKCSLCHTIPEKSLQGQLKADDPTRKVITHQTLIEDKVACESCHLGIVRGSGEIRPEGCYTECHNRSPDLAAKEHDGKLMHERHTATQRADCDDCHAPIVHKKPADYLEVARQECGLCHEDQHRFQKILLAGIPVADGILTSPQMMNAVNTNCMGCHTKDTLGKRGHAVKIGTGEACASCHGPKHKAVAEDWKSTMTQEVESIAAVEQDAIQAIVDAEKSGADQGAMEEAKELVALGTKFLNVVRFGNGVHNKKYALIILDEAIANFEDAIDLLSKGK